MSSKDEYSIFNLNQVHKSWITKYISFIKAKQAKCIKEITSYIDDFKQDNITETMYSKEDIDDMFSKVNDYIKKTIEKEVSHYFNMNAVFVQLLFHDAEKQTITLQVETAQIENMSNIKEMNDFINSMSNLTVPLSQGDKYGKLGSVSNTATLISNYEQLKNEYEMLKEQNEFLNKKNEMLIDENTNLNNNFQASSSTISDLRNKIKELTQGISTKDNKGNVELLHRLEKECAETKKELDEQITKYRALMETFDKKVSESVQFKQWKKLLQDKNTLIVQLKTQVAKYEEK